MEEGKGVAMAILGIVAVIAVVGLILLFTGATGNGSYGGALTRPGTYLYEKGEEPVRYTSPVLEDRGAPYYKHRPSWEGLQRDICPDNARPVVFDVANVGARPDCVPSPTQSPYFCCPAGGQSGYIATGVYE